MVQRCLSLVVLVLFAVACAGDEPRPSMKAVEFSRPPASGEPNLFATRDGRLILTWLEPVDGELYALRLAVKDEGTWSDPVTVYESTDFFVNWADFPSAVELADGSWIVHWLEKVAASPYAYHVKLAISPDRGRSWSQPLVPHSDDSPTEHGFVSMVPWGDTAAALVWLDGRKMKEGEGAAGEGALDPGEMSLRAAIVSSSGEVSEDVLVDGRTCECCQTALVKTKRGLVAAYRDRSESEIRNISVVRYREGVWTEPVYVADDNWYYPGCPVNGPQLSAVGDTVVAAWFTAPDNKAAVYAAYSYDGGESFGPRIKIDEGDPLGRVDVELLADGRAVVVWLERTPSAAELRARLIGPEGLDGAFWIVSETVESRASGFPRMARHGNEVIFAWTLVGEDGGVRVAGLTVP